MIWNWLRRLLLGSASEPVGKDPKDALVEVEGVTRFLVWLGVLGLLVLLVFGLFSADEEAALGFLTWSLIAAIGACLSGMALGMLFGLPTVRRVEIVNKADGSASSATDKNAYLGYAESTNLEQVADWLTKIIIGLTLTQYGSWEAKLARLSYDLTFRLTGQKCDAASCAAGQFPAGSTIPGGFLLLYFSVLGFLLSYLWMRGYFISEMEAAKSIAVRKARADELAQLQRDADRLREEVRQAMSDRDLAVEGRKQADERAATFQHRYEELAQQGRAQSKNVIDPAAAKSIAETAVAKAPKEAMQEAKALVEQSQAPITPDDPWLGQFGGQRAVDGLSLEATVTPAADNPDYFDIRLAVVADKKRREERPVQSAQYYLHPTFGTDPVTVSFNAEGRAPLDLVGYGAFTVGVLVDDGTKLELNLAMLEGVDEKFLSR